MDGLRWLLLLFGLLAVAAVYWYSRREASRPARESADARREPTLGGAQSAQAPAPETETGTGTEPIEPPLAAEDGAAAAAPEKIVTLRLVAARRGAFAGDQLALALRRGGMRHGRFGIFHRYDGDDENRVVFSAASLVEPGSFDLSNLKEQKYPGISLFMVLPGPLEGAEAFDTMMSTARQLAKTLDGELLDETGSTLSIQRERYLREEIIQYQLGIKVA